ncbi:Lrp/AsnC family transcriptional regulator [Arenicella sp. 4NH20-0111]|uniref:Lrp/AsnC family transcriptional regulator n=1 Tax=Arenicella sp. 4NH20-0111 TaxID=3127648 RepID=UPI003340FA7A
MDKVDRAILSELQGNARITNAELAEKVSLSPTPCLRRVRRLEDQGMIRGYLTRLDLDQVGLAISALVFVQLTLNSTANAELFEKSIRGIERIQGCFVMAGRFDYVLRVVARDLRDYEKLIKGELADIPNVKTIESTIILSEVEIDHRLPIPS